MGNLCRRLFANAGPLTLKLEGVILDHGLPDPVDTSAEITPVAELPLDVMPFLMPSRYCESDLLSNCAWSQFGGIAGGWAKVQAICDFVHQRLKFSYPNARETRTAAQALDERIGVCRDFPTWLLRFVGPLTSPLDFATATSVISVYRRIRPRWTSTLGSKLI